MINQAHATGKRKTSVARIWLKPGTGIVTINKRSINEYMCLETDRVRAMEPLNLVGMQNKYDIMITVYGGGTSGQAGAIRHGISKILVQENAEFRPILKKAGMLTRDSRIKERKKYGQRGARARYQFSKR